MNFKSVMRYTSLLLVGLLAGNAFAFVLGMGPAIEKLSASSYLVFHESMQRSFLSWTPMLCGLLVLVLLVSLLTMRREWRKLEFLLIAFALLCVADELFMTWTGHFPLSRSIQMWRETGAPTDWSEIRTQWLHFMYWRCVLLLVGFGFLLASVCIRKNEIPFSRPASLDAAAVV